MEENENLEMSVQSVNNFVDNIKSGMKSNKEKTLITNIMDYKKIFNLETSIDNLLNDCENEIIEVKEILIKKYLKFLDEPEVDENGEIIKEAELTTSCVLIDTNEKAYATGSKMFTLDMLRYLDLLNEMNQIKNNTFEPFKIKIIKTKMSNSNNKRLAFEVL